MHHPVCAIALAAACLSPAICEAASFDCRRASSQSEQLICGAAHFDLEGCSAR